MATQEGKYESLLTKGPFVLLLCFNGGGGGEATSYRQWWQDEETVRLDLMNSGFCWALCIEYGKIESERSG